MAHGVSPLHVCDGSEQKRRPRRGQRRRRANGGPGGRPSDHTGSDGQHSEDGLDASPLAFEPQLRTTLKLANLPQNYSRDMFLRLFDNLGFGGKYDFMFLPIDFNTRSNQGYAFVNLVDSAVAAEFWDSMHGFSKFWYAWGKATCTVSWSDLQGLDAHIELYRNSSLMHELIPDEFKPVFFCQGIRCVFPAPTMPIKLPFGDEPAEEANRDTQSDDGSPSKDTPERTTLMLQNVPRNYTREMLIGLFDNQGFAGQYDFLLVPMNFRTRENQGYLHINFVSCLVAAKFWDTFQSFSQWWRAWCQEECKVSWSPVQGLEANIQRYRNSPLMHESVPDEFKPVLFTDGLRCPFPLPTAKVRPPRIRRLCDGPQGCGRGSGSS